MMHCMLRIYGGFVLFMGMCWVIIDVYMDLLKVSIYIFLIFTFLLRQKSNKKGDPKTPPE